MQDTQGQVDYGFFVDPSRCIGCEACVNACAECETHRGHSMIHMDFIDRQSTIATVPTVCMHCYRPTCAEVCPADAIKQTEDGVVQSSLKPRCIACSNCVLACPFGIPKMKSELEQMMKCDMCYDRTSSGKRPMCATVCPSQALAYVPVADIRKRQEKANNVFFFGNERVTTKVFVMIPPEADAMNIDITDFMWEPEA
jgi:Fe-S-cluster-containing dehydrogenase component